MSRGMGTGWEREGVELAVTTPAARDTLLRLSNLDSIWPLSSRVYPDQRFKPQDVLVGKPSSRVEG
jgi:hypothetical protein